MNQFHMLLVDDEPNLSGLVRLKPVNSKVLIAAVDRLLPTKAHAA
jgi:hypothetical protein